MVENVIISEGYDGIIISHLFSIGAYVLVALVIAFAIKKFRTSTMSWFLLFDISMAALCTGDLSVLITGDVYLQRFTDSAITSCCFLFWMLFFSSSMQTHVSKVLIAFTLSFITALNIMAWIPSTEVNLIASLIGYYFVPIAMTLMFLYWAVLTCIDAPWFAKTSAKLLLLASVLLTIFNVLIIYIPIGITMPTITTASLLCAWVIYKQPGIIAFLPYKAQYVVFLDKQGETIFEQYWTAKKGIIPDDLEEESRNLISLLKQFKGLVDGSKYGEKVIDLGINNSSILIYTGSLHYNVGLIVKHSSKALRDGFSLFIRMVDEIRDKAGIKDVNDISIQVMALLKARMLNLNVII